MSVEINTSDPFLAAAQADNSITGRAVPELQETSYGGSLNLAVSPGLYPAPTLCQTPGVGASFAGLLRNIGYAGALPYPQELESGKQNNG